MHASCERLLMMLYFSLFPKKGKFKVAECEVCGVVRRTGRAWDIVAELFSCNVDISGRVQTWWMIPCKPCSPQEISNGNPIFWVLYWVASVLRSPDVLIFFFSFNDVGYGINTRKLSHTLEIDGEISVLRPSLKQLMKISSRGQILLLSWQQIHQKIYWNHTKCDDYHFGFFSFF